jgi:hypothetical protein
MQNRLLLKNETDLDYAATIQGYISSCIFNFVKTLKCFFNLNQCTYIRVNI